jgi:hypothetical protein
MGLSGELRALALALPAEENPRAMELGKAWAQSIPSPKARVAHALNHFREQPFYYTRRPPLLGPDPVDEFLFESRQGFCEHYAAAFVTLMRASGVPARVVIGYQGGELNPVGKYWVVRQSDAHAWAEVYLEEEGWLRIDPTTAIAAHRIEAGSLEDRGAAVNASTREAPRWALQAWRRVGQSWDAVNYHWNRWIAGYSQERQQELLQRLGLYAWGPVGVAVILVLAVAAILLAAAWVTRRAPRERDLARQVYRRFCHKLARAGLARAPMEGETEYARRIACARPELAEQVTAITEAYQHLRYGRAPAATLRRLRAAVACFRA